MGLSFRDCVSRIREVANIVREIDSEHPVSSIYGEVVGKFDEAVDLLRDEIDIWGINTYRGISFDSMFDQYERITRKPMYLGEYLGPRSRWLFSWELSCTLEVSQRSKTCFRYAGQYSIRRKMEFGMSSSLGFYAVLLTPAPYPNFTNTPRGPHDPELPKPKD